jgi:hypothetical protein
MLLVVAFLGAAAGCAAGGCAGMDGAHGRTPKCELQFFGGRDWRDNRVGISITGLLYPDDWLDPESLNVDSVSVTDVSGRTLGWTQSMTRQTMMGPLLGIYADVTGAAEPVRIQATLTYKGRPYVLEAQFKKYPRRGPDCWRTVSEDLRLTVVGEQQPQGKRGLVP